MKKSKNMKTTFYPATKAQRSIVPITQFEFERFKIRVRQVTRPSDAASYLKILLPSPSLQGHGWMRLHLGVRPVDHPAALSSRRLHRSAPNGSSAGTREPEETSLLSHE